MIERGIYRSMILLGYGLQGVVLGAFLVFWLGGGF